LVHMKFFSRHLTALMRSQVSLSNAKGLWRKTPLAEVTVCDANEADSVFWDVRVGRPAKTTCV
jgi:hypothetical protein